MQPDLILTPFGENATPGTIDPIPQTSGPGDDPQQATWDKGFPLVTMTPLAAGGIPPKGQDFNGVLKAISEHTVYSGAGGQYTWSAAYVAANVGYPKGALVARSDHNGYWQNTVDLNTSNPDTGGAGWLPLSGRGGDFAIDTGTANNYVCAFTPAITARIEGQVLKFKVKTANNGASTFNDGLGSAPLVGGAQSVLQGGELVANGDAWVQWNTSVGGGSYILLLCTGAAEQVSPATQSKHAMQYGQAIGRLIGTQTFGLSNSPGSTVYTPTPGTSYVIVELCGGGGGGGGAQATTAGQVAAGGGGGGGGFAKAKITSAFAGVTIVVGAGGSGGALAANGAAGTSSSFGALLSATGGGGGNAGFATAPPGQTAGGISGQGTLGTITNSAGSSGGSSTAMSVANTISGYGGGSVYGGGAVPRGASSPGIGLAATSPGAGGSGGLVLASSAGIGGGDGRAGTVIIWEYQA